MQAIEMLSHSIFGLLGCQGAQVLPVVLTAVELTLVCRFVNRRQRQLVLLFGMLRSRSRDQTFCCSEAFEGFRIVVQRVVQLALADMCDCTFAVQPHGLLTVSKSLHVISLRLEAATRDIQVTRDLELSRHI